MKNKTHKGTAKRVKVTGSGKLVREQANRRHLLEGKPSRSTCPLSGAVMRVMMRIRVVFPAPLGPNNPKTDPRGT